MALTKAHNRMITGSPANIFDFGAVGDGVTDDKAAIQLAIDSGSKHVIVPKGYVFIISDELLLPSDFTFEVNGDLTLAPNTADDTTMIRNSDQVNYQNNIHITGTGRILGNKANQQGRPTQIRHTCIFLKKVSGCTVSTAEIGGNKWDNLYTTPTPSGIAACVQINDCNVCKVHDVLLYQWEKEGINIDPAGGRCYSNMVNDCICEGSGAFSYSGIQMGGLGGTSYNNIIDNCIVRDCGASAIGMDSTHSNVTNCSVFRNGYGHGINLGHSSAIADYCVVANCTLYDIGNFTTSGDSAGINIGNGSKNVTISNCNMDIINNSGINISTGVSSLISNCRIDNAGQHGFKLNIATGVKIENCVVKNQGLSILSETGAPNNDLWYTINETEFKRYGAIDAEGSWTPVLVGSSTSGTHTYTTQVGFYERNGRLVNFRGRLTLSTKGTIAGNLTITGLPFTSSSIASSYGDFEANAARNLAITAGQSIDGTIQLNSDIINLEIWDATTGTSLMTAAQITANSQIFFSGSYMV